MIIYLNSIGTFMYHDIHNKLVNGDGHTIALLEDFQSLYTVDGRYSPYFREIN